jgi:4-amino-4-deoxy-L-arabinose transferase-like glycosyltransferase
MNAPTAPAPRFLGLSAAPAAILLIAVLTLFRFWYCTWLPMVPDETYYFQWSRHLDASYISKGPAVAYTIALGTALFGDNAFGVRFFSVMLSAGTAWQLFLLARRWYDETAALLAVLIAGVIPLYAVGSVLMTIDPLSAFFWVWAANHFSSALHHDRLTSWLGAGFAVGGGFLAKYLNALELLAFLAFLLVVPARRRLLGRPGFWWMVATAFLCTLPVLWWNARHHWATASQLGDRGQLNQGLHLQVSTFLGFLGAQSLIVSPLLFVVLLASAAISAAAFLKRTRTSEGELLLLLLFLSVFLFYAVLSFHLRCEPNWPAISYLSLIVILAGHWRSVTATRTARIFFSVAFVVAWLETVLLHDTAALPLPRHADPMSRTAGWTAIAGQVEQFQRRLGADTIVADGYKEASILAFDLPGKPFVFALRHHPPANQFDLWPGFPTAPPHRILWISDDQPPTALQNQFNTIIPIERIQVWFRGTALRGYRLYLCENRPVASTTPP